MPLLSGTDAAESGVSMVCNLFRELAAWRPRDDVAATAVEGGRELEAPAPTLLLDVFS